MVFRTGSGRTPHERQVGHFPFAPTDPANRKACRSTSLISSTSSYLGGACCCLRWLSRSAIALIYVIVAPTRYTASLSLLVDPRDRVPVGVEAQAMPQNPDPALVESQMRVLTSKAVLRQVVESEDLARRSRFPAGADRTS